MRRVLFANGLSVLLAATPGFVTADEPVRQPRFSADVTSKHIPDDLVAAFAVTCELLVAPDIAANSEVSVPRALLDRQLVSGRVRWVRSKSHGFERLDSRFDLPDRGRDLGELLDQTVIDDGRTHTLLFVRSRQVLITPSSGELRVWPAPAALLTPPAAAGLTRDSDGANPTVRWQSADAGSSCVINYGSDDNGVALPRSIEFVRAAPSYNRISLMAG